MALLGITSVDSIVSTLQATVQKLSVVATERQAEVVELTDKLNVSIAERDRATRIADKLNDLLA